MNKISRLVLLSISVLPFTSFANEVLVDCNRGALTIYRDSGSARYATGVVSDREAVNYILGESLKNLNVRDTNGNSQNVTAGLPNGVEIQDTLSTVIVIHQMQYQNVDGGYATGGPVGVQMKPFARGADLTFVNGKMTSSHSQAIWTTANWWFDSCTYSK